jgi:hypothetical protein
VTRVITPNLEVVEVRPDAVTERAWELLDQVRQWSYSRVTRRANLARHRSSCGQCGRHERTPETYRRCSEETHLDYLTAECDRVLERLQGKLRTLDDPEPVPPAAVQAELFG